MIGFIEDKINLVTNLNKKLKNNSLTTDRIMN